MNDNKSINEKKNLLKDFFNILTIKLDLDDYENYYEFDELDGSGSFPLIDENEKIASPTVADILNYFGADDWESSKENIYVNVEEKVDYFLC